MPSARSLAGLIVQTLEHLGGEGDRRTITETALLLGEFSALQLAEPTHSVEKRDTYPTELLYRLSWAITHARRAGDIERVRPSVWRLANS